MRYPQVLQRAFSGINSPAKHLKHLSNTTPEIYTFAASTISSSASIHTLPNELLEEIFLHCCSYTSDNHFVRPNSREAPLLLCQISSHWRQLAQSMPALWSSLTLKHLSGLGFDLSIGRQWLNMSKDTSLSLEAASGYVPDVYKSLRYEVYVEDAFSLVLENVHRWKILSVQLNDSLAARFLGVPDRSSPQLEGIKISIPRSISKDSMEALPSKLSSFKRLRRLTWSTRSTPSSFLSVPWSQLTHIEILCPLSPSTCLAILKQSLQAVDIYISCIKEADSSAIEQTIVLPNVKYFRLHSRSDAGEVLRHLTLPALHTLQLFNKRERRLTCDYQALEDFLVRSQCSLQQLIFTDLEGTDEDIYHYLQLPILLSIPLVIFTTMPLTGRISDLLRSSSVRELQSRVQVHDRQVGWSPNSDDNIVLHHLKFITLFRNVYCNQSWQY
ncbi:hypothetical protein BDQ12DRAFT_736109 [Crucibulum laeve]|uniref:F-box domain-containing protein n=1 Tax=Crucibulum laeve TaxID=68775 RepID=A0A5C3LZP5_9AGAR|nr:hypothetical protein BDQ12DRAFT_736109 [Crucibulum laeve]